MNKIKFTFCFVQGTEHPKVKTTDYADWSYNNADHAGSAPIHVNILSVAGTYTSAFQHMYKNVQFHRYI